EPVIVPLAVPLVAGPSSLATVILLSKQDQNRMHIWFSALLAAWAVSFFILYFSSFIQKIIGDRVLTAIERLMGMILTTMSVQMLLSGLKDFINNL
ncbi:MAG TPA: MarC family protein, partial [Leptospiraceae bacterium]|nr:MarC family protein [Leptospiraceae bacterium]